MLQILLKRHKHEKKFSFHNAIVLANLLKNVIHTDDAKLTLLETIKHRIILYEQRVIRFVKQNTMKFTQSFQNVPSFKRSVKKGMPFNSQEVDDEYDVDDEENEYGLSLEKTQKKQLRKNLSRSLSRTETFQHSVSQNARYATQKLNETIQGIVKSQFFRYYELLCISINFVILCNYKTDMSTTLTLQLCILNANLNFVQ
jgi:hypothetical protein